MNRLRIVIVMLMALLLVTACRQTEPPPARERSLAVEMDVQPQPPATGEATLFITIRDATGNPVTDAQVVARGDMSHAGMVPVLGEAQGGEDGIYTVPFEWTMAGDWFVDVTVTLANGDEVQQRFDVSVAGEMSHDEMMQDEMATDEAAGSDDG